jgi:hypothetical protein
MDPLEFVIHKNIIPIRIDLSRFANGKRGHYGNTIFKIFSGHGKGPRYQVVGILPVLLFITG